jgi:hypothetical protein
MTSLRAERSNPAVALAFLDCFVSLLAMTMTMFAN